MDRRSCTDCRRSRGLNGAMRCEESRSNAIGGVIVIDVEQARRFGTLERICALIGGRCAFFQIVS